ncbi:MAG: AAA family ATPase [Candidatus Hydrogenedentales bacterium]|jgi:DNA repair exonuclease SbcCD ATPase subunit
MSEKTAERARILTLRVKNVKSIKEVSIDHLGDIHDIRGDAGQGKSSVLASIEGAFQGLDPDMVRRGKDPAEIELVLSNDTRIKRIVSGDGSKKVVMVTHNGRAVAKAEDFLRQLCDSSTFRPVEWVKMAGGEAKGRTERTRAQRNQLLQALNMSITAEELVESVVTILGPDFKEALAEVDLEEVHFDQHALTVCSSIHKACYTFRGEQNKIVERAEAYLSTCPAPDRAAPRESVADLEVRSEAASKALHTAEAMSKGREELIARRDTLKRTIESKTLPDRAKADRTLAHYESEVKTTQGEIEQLEAQLKAARQKYSEVWAKYNEAEKVVSEICDQDARIRDLELLNSELSMGGAVADFDALKVEVENAKADLQARRLQDAHDKAAESAVAARERAEVFTRLVEFFKDDLPKLIIQKAKLPVDGLTIDDDSILINGIPLHQLGTSEQIKVGVLVAASLNPNSGFVLVDGAESMGRADRLALAEAAEALGLQLIMTFVDPDAEPSEHVTVMRDGLAVEPAA